MNDFYASIPTVFPDWQYGHPMLLHGLIRSMKPQVCVEVGSYLGFGAAWMAQALKENGSGHLFCIDNYGLVDRPIQQGHARRHMERNLAMLGLTDWVTIIEGDSDKVTWPDNIGIAYVDGWHGYLAVKHDFEQCASRGAECICLDDTVQSIGPRMLTLDIRQSGAWDVLDVLRDCGLTICMRKQPKGAITFSQELPPPNKGVDLQTLAPSMQRQHLTEASDLNGVDYSPILHLLHEGSPQ